MKHIRTHTHKTEAEHERRLLAFVNKPSSQPESVPDAPEEDVETPDEAPSAQATEKVNEAKRDVENLSTQVASADKVGEEVPEEKQKEGPAETEVQDVQEQVTELNNATENAPGSPEEVETGPASEIDKALNTIRSEEATAGQKITAALAALAILKNMWDQIFGGKSPEEAKSSSAEQADEAANDGPKEEKEGENEEASEQPEESPDDQKDRLKTEIEEVGSVDDLVEQKEEIVTNETLETQEKLDTLDKRIDSLRGDVTKLEGGKRDLEQELTDTEDAEVRKDLQMEIDLIDARIEARNKEVSIVEKRHDELLERKRTVDNNEGKDVEALRAMKKAFEKMREIVGLLQEKMGDNIPEGMDITFNADTLTVSVTLDQGARQAIEDLGISLAEVININADGIVEDPRQVIVLLQKIIENQKEEPEAEAQAAAPRGATEEPSEAATEAPSENLEIKGVVDDLRSYMKTVGDSIRRRVTMYRNHVESTQQELDDASSLNVLDWGRQNALQKQLEMEQTTLSQALDALSNIDSVGGQVDAKIAIAEDPSTDKQQKLAALNEGTTILRDFRATVKDANYAEINSDLAAVDQSLGDIEENLQSIVDQANEAVIAAKDLPSQIADYVGQIPEAASQIWNKDVVPAWNEYIQPSLDSAGETTGEWLTGIQNDMQEIVEGVKILSEGTASEFGQGYKEQFAKMYGSAMNKLETGLKEQGVPQQNIDNFKSMVESSFDSTMKRVDDLNS